MNKVINLNTLLLLIKNTIYKEWRSKALVFLMVLTVISLVIIGGIITMMKEQFSLSMGMDIIGDQAMSFFFWGVNLWNVFLSVYFGISTITTDRESGVVVQLLSFPMTRFEYLLGRILGCWCVILIYYTVATILGMSGISLSAGVWIGGTPLLWAFALSSLTWLASITIAVFAATLTTKLAAFIAVSFVNMLMWTANSYFSQHGLGSAFEPFSIFKSIGALIYSLLPHVSYWSAMVNEKLFESEGKGIVSFEVFHFAGSYIFLFLVLWQVFRKREL